MLERFRRVEFKAAKRSRAFSEQGKTFSYGDEGYRETQKRLATRKPESLKRSFSLKGRFAGGPTPPFHERWEKMKNNFLSHKDWGSVGKALIFLASGGTLAVIGFEAILAAGVGVSVFGVLAGFIMALGIIISIGAVWKAFRALKPD